MGKLLASDVNRYGERQIVPMCSVVSEDTLRDAQFIGGECKLRVVVPLYSTITIENRACSRGVSSPAGLTPVSDETHERHTTSVDCIGLYRSSDTSLLEIHGNAPGKTTRSTTPAQMEALWNLT